MSFAERRREIIMAVLEERGPCLMNYLVAMVSGRMPDCNIVTQTISNDVDVLRKACCVSTAKVTGLAIAQKIHGQLLTVVYPIRKDNKNVGKPRVDQ